MFKPMLDCLQLCKDGIVPESCRSLLTLARQTISINVFADQNSVEASEVLGSTQIAPVEIMCICIVLKQCGFKDAVSISV